MSDSNRYAIIENGTVTNVVSWDGVPFTPAVEPDENGEGGSPASGWSPPNGATAVKLESDSPVSIGWAYDGSTFAAPPAPPLPVPTMAEKQAQQAMLMTQATGQIAVLTDATDPDIVDTVDPADVAKLKAWKQYRVALSKLDLSPATPNWPNPPA